MPDIKNASSVYSSTSPIKTSPNEIKKAKTADFWQKHSATKNLSYYVEKSAIKTAAVAVLVLSSPLILLGLLAVGVYQLKEVIADKLFANSLQKAVDHMKEEEETIKFKALSKTFTDLKSDKTNAAYLTELKQHINNSLNSIELKQQKLARVYIKALAREGKDFDKEQILEAVKNLNVEDFQSQDSLKSKLPHKWQETLQDTLPLFFAELAATEPNNIHVYSDKMIKQLDSLFKLLDESNSSDAEEANQKITAKLRDILNSSAYLALKEDGDHPAINLLHHLASTIWNKVEVLNTYEALGKVILEDVDIDANDEATFGQNLQARLKASHSKASKDLLTQKSIGSYLIYALAHPKHTIQSITSEGGFLSEVTALVGLGTYDPHGKLGNNPSIQGKTEAHFIASNGDSIKATINNCYGGSPTNGDKYMSEEFDAVCQATENKQFCKTLSSKIPDVVYYTNLQNIENPHGEGERSRTIMNQNERFPLSFRGITLAKDSSFYMMRGDLKDNIWNSADEFGDDMLKAMTADTCFTLEARKGDASGNGFYFPGKKEDWQPLFTSIIEKAKEHFKDYSLESGKTAYKLKGAFQEYVYSMLQSYLEIKYAKEMADKNNQPPVVMAIRACKENIDRGGIENTKYMYTRLEEDVENKEELIAGVFHSRALSARDRVILGARLPQTFAFMEYVEPESFKNANREFLEGQNFQFAEDGEPHYSPVL